MLKCPLPDHIVKQAFLVGELLALLEVEPMLDHCVKVVHLLFKQSFLGSLSVATGFFDVSLHLLCVVRQ